MQATVGGNYRYPSLQSLCDQFRFLINDTFNNTGGSGTGFGGGAGLVMPNVNPDVVTLLDMACREVYADLRNVGDPELLLDNYILTGIPPLTQPDQSVQVSLGYMGYFDGFQWHSEWTLPTSVARMMGMWERLSNVGEDFRPMIEVPAGLGGVLQGTRMGYWEMRQGQIWMPGCLSTVDLRIRARISYPDFSSYVLPDGTLRTSLNFSTAYVPILDCQNALVAKMLVKYAMRFAPERYEMALAEEQRQMAKLRLESTRQRQRQVNRRTVYEEGAEEMVPAYTWL